MRRAALLLACLALSSVALFSLALAGCGTGASPSSTTTSAIARRVAAADRTHEYRSGPAPPQSVPAAARSPEAALTAFAAAYINWTASSIPADMSVLAAASVGQARAEMQLAAARTAQDYELQRGGIANSGTVEAVAPVSGQHDRYVVVTLERTTATNTNAYAGLAPAWHLTLATVEPFRGGWVVSAWQPEN